LIRRIMLPKFRDSHWLKLDSDQDLMRTIWVFHGSRMERTIKWGSDFKHALIVCIQNRSNYCKTIR
jgi:hypothetical protein